MCSAAAASLIRRRRCVVQFFDPLRYFSTQTLTDSSSNEEIERIRRSVPKLMVPSRDQNPRSCGLFSLCRSLEKDGKDRNFFKLEREIHLPETAAADKNLCIGSSEGVIFTTPEDNPAEIFAVDPLTGTHLPLPPTASIQACRGDGGPTALNLHEGKAVISPSRDTIALNHAGYLHFARSADRCWTLLPNGFGYISDIIFHKGLLYALDYDGLLGAYDLNNPSSSPSVLGDESLGWEEDCIYPTWLVESPDGKDLFLVYRNSREFKVYKLNREGKWTRVRSIGDVAIFIGMNQSVSLSASHFLDILKPNSIYFSEILWTAWPKDPLNTRDMGVYSLDDQSFQYFKLTNGQDNILDWPSWPPSVWFIPATTS